MPKRGNARLQGCLKLLNSLTLQLRRMKTSNRVKSLHSRTLS